MGVGGRKGKRSGGVGVFREEGGEGGHQLLQSIL